MNLGPIWPPWKMPANGDLTWGLCPRTPPRRPSLSRSAALRAFAPAYPRMSLANMPLMPTVGLPDLPQKGDGPRPRGAVSGRRGPSRIAQVSGSRTGCEERSFVVSPTCLELTESGRDAGTCGKKKVRQGSHEIDHAQTHRGRRSEPNFPNSGEDPFRAGRSRWLTSQLPAYGLQYSCRSECCIGRALRLKLLTVPAHHMCLTECYQARPRREGS